MYLIYRNTSYRQMQVSRLIVLILVLSFSGSTLEILISFALHNVFLFKEAAFSDNSIRVGVLYYRAGLFASWSFLYFVLRLYYESRDLNRRLVHAMSECQETEVQLFRSQMNPHFLFNALTTIHGSVERSREELRRIIQSLGDYLRYAAAAGESIPSITFEAEADLAPVWV